VARASRQKDFALAPPLVPKPAPWPSIADLLYSVAFLPARSRGGSSTVFFFFFRLPDLQADHFPSGGSSLVWLQDNLRPRPLGLEGGWPDCQHRRGWPVGRRSRVPCFTSPRCFVAGFLFRRNAGGCFLPGEFQPKRRGDGELRCWASLGGQSWRSSLQRGGAGCLRPAPPGFISRPSLAAMFFSPSISIWIYYVSPTPRNKLPAPDRGENPWLPGPRVLGTSPPVGAIAQFETGQPGRREIRDQGPAAKE